jgi:hypothetical protein
VHLYTMQAGGAVLGLYWADLTRDGLREFLLVCHDGVRVQQADLDLAVEQLRSGLGRISSLQDVVRRAEDLTSLSHQPVSQRALKDN